MPRDQKTCEVGRVRKGFWRKEAGSSLERCKAPEEGVMGHVAEGRKAFQIYQGSGETRGNQMPSVGNVCLFWRGSSSRKWGWNMETEKGMGRWSYCALSEGVLRRWHGGWMEGQAERSSGLSSAHYPTYWAILGSLLLQTISRVQA